MAMDLVARLSLKDNLSARMRKVTGSLGSAEKQTRSLTERMGGLKGALAGIGVTAGMGALVKGIVGIGVSFDTQMSKVKAVSGATEEQFQALRNTARQLGKDTKYSMTEAGEGMEYLALAGWKTEAIITAMPGMLNLAAAGALDLGRAADITSDTMQAFGIAAEHVTHVADVFAYAQANANTNVEQMGDAMTYLAPVANALGWKLEESAAAMMAVADAGIKGSMGGQAFATSMARLAKPTKAMNAEMKRLDMNLFTAKGELKSMPDLVGELEKATKGMTAQQRSSTITTLFGAQAYKHWAVLLERGSEDLRQMTTDLENSDGAAAAMAETMIDNLGGAWQIFMSGVAEAAYSIYEKFEPAMRGAVKALTRLVGKVPDAIDMLIKITKPFAPLAKAIGIAVLAATSFFAVVGTFKLIGMAIMLLVSPIGLAIGAITGMVLAFQHFYKTNKPFRTGIESIINTVKGFMSAMNGEYKSAHDILAKAGLSPENASKVMQFSRSVKDAIDYVKTAINALMTGDTVGLMEALGFSPEAIGGIYAFVENVKTKVTEFVTFLGAKWEELQPSIAMLLERLMTMKDTAVSIFTSLWGLLTPIFNALMNAFHIIADVAVMVFNNIIAPAIDFLISTFQTLWKIVGPILDYIGAAIELNFAILKMVWDSILKPVAAFLMGEFKKSLEDLKPVLDAIGGLFDWLGGLISGVADIFRNITDAIKSFKVPNWLSKLGGGGTVKFESNEGTGGKGKSNYHGIDYVPYDGYQATLHRGEKVVTAQENREKTQGGGGSPISISGNTFNVRQESDIEAVALKLAKLIEIEGGQMA